MRRRVPASTFVAAIYTTDEHVLLANSVMMWKGTGYKGMHLHVLQNLLHLPRIVSVRQAGFDPDGAHAASPAAQALDSSQVR